MIKTNPKPLPLACVLAYAVALLCVLCFGLAVERGARERETIKQGTP